MKKEYYEKLFALTFDSLDKRYQFIGRQTIKLTGEEINTLNRPVSVKKIESIFNSHPKQKAPVPVGFTGEFYQTCREESVSNIYNLFQRTEAEGIFPNLVHEVSVTLIPKPVKDIIRKKTENLYLF